MGDRDEFNVGFEVSPMSLIYSMFAFIPDTPLRIGMTDIHRSRRYSRSSRPLGHSVRSRPTSLDPSDARSTSRMKVR